MFNFLKKFTRPSSPGHYLVYGTKDNDEIEDNDEIDKEFYYYICEKDYEGKYISSCGYEIKNIKYIEKL